MTQADFIISDQSGLSLLGDLTNNLQAAVTLSSGPSAPTTTYASQFWWDTTNNIINIRNGANSAWIGIMPFDGSVLGFRGNGAAFGHATLTVSGTTPSLTQAFNLGNPSRSSIGQYNVNYFGVNPTNPANVSVLATPVSSPGVVRLCNVINKNVSGISVACYEQNVSNQFVVADFGFDIAIFNTP